MEDNCNATNKAAGNGSHKKHTGVARLSKLPVCMTSGGIMTVIPNSTPCTAPALMPEVSDTPMDLIIGGKFPTKLWHLVNNCQNGGIRWGPEGFSVVFNTARFQRYLNSAEMETNDAMLSLKIKSFQGVVRQMNKYGFSKCEKRFLPLWDEDENPADLIEFENELFVKDEPQLLRYITRGMNVIEKGSGGRSSSNVIQDIKQIPHFLKRKLVEILPDAVKRRLVQHPISANDQAILSWAIPLDKNLMLSAPHQVDLVRVRLNNQGELVPVSGETLEGHLRETDVRKGQTRGLGKEERAAKRRQHVRQGGTGSHCQRSAFMDGKSSSEQEVRQKEHSRSLPTLAPTSLRMSSHVQHDFLTKDAADPFHNAPPEEATSSPNSVSHLMKALCHMIGHKQQRERGRMTGNTSKPTRRQEKQIPGIRQNQPWKGPHLKEQNTVSVLYGLPKPHPVSSPYVTTARVGPLGSFMPVLHVADPDSSVLPVASFEKMVTDMYKAVETLPLSFWALKSKAAEQERDTENVGAEVDKLIQSLFSDEDIQHLLVEEINKQQDTPSPDSVDCDWELESLSEYLPMTGIESITPYVPSTQVPLSLNDSERYIDNAYGLDTDFLDELSKNQESSDPDSPESEEDSRLPEIQSLEREGTETEVNPTDTISLPEACNLLQLPTDGDDLLSQSQGSENYYNDILPSVASIDISTLISSIDAPGSPDVTSTIHYQSQVPLRENPLKSKRDNDPAGIVTSKETRHGKSDVERAISDFDLSVFDTGCGPNEDYPFMAVTKSTNVLCTSTPPRRLISSTPQRQGTKETTLHTPKINLLNTPMIQHAGVSPLTYEPFATIDLASDVFFQAGKETPVPSAQPSPFPSIPRDPLELAIAPVATTYSIPDKKLCSLITCKYPSAPPTVKSENSKRVRSISLVNKEMITSKEDMNLETTCFDAKYRVTQVGAKRKIFQERISDQLPMLNVQHRPVVRSRSIRARPPMPLPLRGNITTASDDNMQGLKSATLSQQNVPFIPKKVPSVRLPMTDLGNKPKQCTNLENVKPESQQPCMSEFKENAPPGVPGHLPSRVDSDQMMYNPGVGYTFAHPGFPPGHMMSSVYGYPPYGVPGCSECMCSCQKANTNLGYVPFSERGTK